MSISYICIIFFANNSFLKYRLYKHAIQNYAIIEGFNLGEILDATFILPMPKSWSKKKKQLMHGKPHIIKPDLDNIIKF